MRISNSLTHRVQRVQKLLELVHSIETEINSLKKADCDLFVRTAQIEPLERELKDIKDNIEEVWKIIAQVTVGPACPSGDIARTDVVGPHSEAQPKTPEKKKKKKKEALQEFTAILQEIKARFHGENQLFAPDKERVTLQLTDPKPWKDSPQILKTLDEIEKLFTKAALEPEVSLISRYTIAMDTKQALTDVINKLNEIGETLKQAEYQETDNTMRSVLYDNQKKITDLRDSIAYYIN